MKKKLKQWYERYERWLMPLTLVFGSAADFVTFRLINMQTTYWLIGAYYAAILVCMVLVCTLKTPRWHAFAKYVLSFSFGSLISASLVFYWFSGAFSVSWPVILVLAFLMISQEVFAKRFFAPVVQSVLLYFVTFSIGTLVLPYVMKSLNPVWFFVAGFGSFILVGAYVFGLSKWIKEVQEKSRSIFAGMAVVLVLMISLYLGNVIPPLPLSLCEAGVYHNIVRSGGHYEVTAEKLAWWDALIPGQTIHVSKTNTVYVFSSIFAPAKLNTRIVHRWQWYDATQKKWIDKEHLSFALVGGRDGGYRGYSMKSNTAAGKWRVRMETEQGLVVGSIGFTVVVDESNPMLETQWK